MNSQEAYRDFCQSRTDLPLFVQPFWLDVTCEPEGWDAVFAYHEDGSVKGAWAYCYGRKYGMQWLRLPILTPFSGIWIDTSAENSPQKEIAYRHKVLSELEVQLPRAHVVELKLPWTFQDWLPLYWRGYRQETRYTFRFPQIDVDKIYTETSKSFRRNLRAAERHYTLVDGEISDLYALMENVFEMKESRVSFSQQKLQNIVDALQSRNQCRIQAVSHEGTVEAIVLSVWDQHTTYSLIGGRQRKDSRDGMSLLLWQSIIDASKRGQAFDFEGSMMQGVNRFFQNFGAQLTPYHYIYKYRGPARIKYLYR